MKTIKEVEKEIAQINLELTNDSKKYFSDKGKFTPNKIGKLMKRIEFLNGLALYLKSNPSEDYLKSELDRINKSIKNANSGYSYWEKYNAPKDVDPKKYKTLYASTVGLGKLKKQLKTIDYLLAA